METYSQQAERANARGQILTQVLRVKNNTVVENGGESHEYFDMNQSQRLINSKENRQLQNTKTKMLTNVYEVML